MPCERFFMRIKRLEYMKNFLKKIFILSKVYYLFMNCDIMDEEKKRKAAKEVNICQKRLPPK